MTKEERTSLFLAIARSVEELSRDLMIHPVDVLDGLIVVMQVARPEWRREVENGGRS